eukprot:CAMPEP_0201592244 /NCGR_PEP_ID=MMETSP0190_2-20130828/190195_1 /ASSEMBLY_ACC=CAM_ASM_000263 /TAXON_ID=37353 /ORGANISM="Rosalina sp." /LENGTH=314 /DNA_ID=CAMNT_0048050933 /DNA_START=152 /DNA_END=1097 /DNA_ORIENTATION=-
MGVQSVDDSDPKSDFTYTFAICGNLTDTCQVNPDPGTGALQQFDSGSIADADDDTCVEWLSTWDTSTANVELTNVSDPDGMYNMASQYIGQMEMDKEIFVPGTGALQQFDSGSIADADDDTCVEWLSTWDASTAIVELTNASDPDGGISIYWGEGDGDGNYCGTEKKHPIYYQTTWIFNCDKSTKFKAQYAQVNALNSCQYEVVMDTWFACAGYDPPSNGASTSSGFSLGYVAIICFFAAIILGLVIYYVILGATSKNWGKESLTPPFNLCKYFWVYTCVGCKVSFEWAKTKMNKGEGGGTDAIDDDQLIDTDE